MQVRKSTAELSPLRPVLPTAEAEDARELMARNPVRPVAPLPRSERLAGPFRVKASSSYLERRAWPFCGY